MGIMISPSCVTRDVTIFVTIFVTSVRGHQEWKEEPRSTTALEGQDAVIACKVYNKEVKAKPLNNY